MQGFEYLNFKEGLCYGEDILFNYVNFMLCEKFFISKECIYHYEFNENGRYENKNKEILWQNYRDKKRSLELIKIYLLILKKNDFHNILLQILQRENDNLQQRIEK